MSELESLYARRSEINATIDALECRQGHQSGVNRPAVNQSLEIPQTLVT